MYRINAKPIIKVDRWGVSSWRKLYVRIVRIFFDIRSKYLPQRRYKQYLRDLSNWDKQHSDWKLDDKKVLSYPPKPLPPPIYIKE